MITITRRQARALRAVLRRSALGIAHRGPIPPILLSVEGGRLLARHRHARLAVEHAWPSQGPPSQEVALPMEALADLEGRDEAAVDLEAAAPDRTTARWPDRGIPRSREYAVPALDAIARCPAPPDAWADPGPGLLDALAEAAATAAEGDTHRYAMGCLALRGGDGSVAATDGRHVLIRGGLAFPWAGNLLIDRSPLFACRGLPRDQPVGLGRAGGHVALRVGPWTIWAEARAGVRFPDVDAVLPAPGSAAARLHLDPGDARFLLDALGRLPEGERADGPATVDLNGRVAVRARAAGGPATELVLSRSTYSGDPVRFPTGRECLARAIRLGVSELEVTAPDAPIVGRAGDLVFAWMPSSRDSAVGPSDDAVRIESDPHPDRPDPAGGPPQEESTVDGRKHPEGGEAADPVGPGGRSPAADPAPAGLAALIAEAEALHGALGEARSRAGRLAVALRKQRRREKLVASTLASLRGLRLPDVAE